MALNKVKLEADIKELMTAMVDFDEQDGKNQEEAIKKYAQELSAAIDAFVKSGTVKTRVTGTCPVGAITGIGEGGVV